MRGYREIPGEIGVRIRKWGRGGIILSASCGFRGAIGGLKSLTTGLERDPVNLNLCKTGVFDDQLVYWGCLLMHSKELTV